MFRSKLVLSFSLSITFLCLTTAQSTCADTTCLALGSYYVWSGANLTFISTLTTDNISYIQSYNPQITNPNLIIAGSKINIPFSCGCIDGDSLGHVFQYTVQAGDSYYEIAETYYANLTTIAMLEDYNSYNDTDIPVHAELNVTVTCSCGDTSVSNASAVFVTYPLRAEDSLESIAAAWSVSTDLLQKYNPGVNFSSGSDLVYIPDNDSSSLYSPRSPDIAPSYHAKQSSSDNNTPSSSGTSAGLIAGISIGAVMVILLVAVCIYCGYYRQKGKHVKINGPQIYEDQPLQVYRGGLNFNVEFSNKELAVATENFSDAHKIGEGGFAVVYYAELRGKKTAIKKMALTENTTKQFHAELQILSQVNHVNLVRLIGYCVGDSYFLVYEHIENGNLSEHLHGTGWDPLSWPTRLRIALDSARGLEYIHMYTEPVYVHRDVKPANILIDKSSRAKVADFGLTKLHQVVSSTPSRLGGTFGYMPPEFQNGDISPAGDVYAFGVVLYELISAKKAIVKSDESTAKPIQLSSLFEEALSKPDPKEDLCKLIDPRLGNNYPYDLVLELAQLAKRCTEVKPELRPTMGFVVVYLTRLSSSTEDHLKLFKPRVAKP